jgi:hypothetical protein
MSGDYAGAVERERGLKRKKAAARRELQGLIDMGMRAEEARQEAQRRAEKRAKAARLEAERVAEFGGLATAKWKTSQSGNPWCVVEGRRCVIFKAQWGWSGMIADVDPFSVRRERVGPFGSTAEVMRAMRAKLWPVEAGIQYGRGIAVARVVRE